MKSILVALTNIPTYGEKNAATGLWLGEAAEFVDEVGKRGYAVDYVSPQGGYVPLDPRSMKRTYADAATFALYRSQDFQERALARSMRPEHRQILHMKSFCIISGCPEECGETAHFKGL